MAGITVHLPVKVELYAGYMEMDGVRIAYDVLPQLIAAITKPDPRKWYRFERVNQTVTVYTKISEEGANGPPIGCIGNTQQPNPEGTGGER